MNDRERLMLLAERTAREIGPLLAGKPPEVQGAVLAELVSRWLAGHFADGREQTDSHRREQLAAFVGLVEQLLPLNENLILGGIRHDG